MILTCPSCATSYFAPDESIGTTGRKVRCQACSNVWRARLNEEPLELTTAPDPAPMEAALSGGSKTEFGKREDAPESLAETPAPELPKAFRARAEQQRRIRRAATHGAVWAGLASVFVAILAAGWLFRVEVVEMYPRAAAAYAMIGSPVNPIGLQFEAVGARPSPNDPNTVLVQGALRNVRDREVVAPAVRLALLDAHGAEIGHSIVRIDAAPVLPGGVQGFAALIPDPGAKGAGVGVDFVMAPRAGKQAETHAATPGPGGQSGHDAAPALRRPPPADEGGLRPALSREVNAPMPVTPVDARPVAEAPLDRDLDRIGGEAVLPPHHG